MLQERMLKTTNATVSNSEGALGTSEGAGICPSKEGSDVLRRDLILQDFVKAVTNDKVVTLVTELLLKNSV